VREEGFRGSEIERGERKRLHSGEQEKDGGKRKTSIDRQIDSHTDRHPEEKKERYV